MDQVEQTEQKTEQVRVVSAEDVVAYLESLVLYMEALQQDIIKNISKVMENKDNA